DCDATHLHRLPARRISHEHRLFVHWATARGALASGTTEALALYLAVLTDRKRGAPAGHAKHQPPRAKVAILDPEMILLDVVEQLSDQAPFLRMAIFAQKHIGNQHALLVQRHQRLAREGRRTGTA